jgi:hypothetical protein
MNSYIEDLIGILHQEQDSEPLEEAISEIASSFEKIAGNSRDDTWPKWLEEQSFSDLDKFALKKAAIRFVKSDNRYKSNMVWALGKLGDADLKKLFTQILNSSVKSKDNPTIYQCMCALGILGEQVFKTGSASILDERENLEQAVSYLRKTRGH